MRLFTRIGAMHNTTANRCRSGEDVLRLNMGDGRCHSCCMQHGSCICTVGDITNQSYDLQVCCCTLNSSAYECDEAGYPGSCP